MKKYLLLFVCLMASVMMWADDVTRQETLEKARQYMHGKELKQQEDSRCKVQKAGLKNSLCYAFNAVTNDGAIIVSSTDRTEDILDYSELGIENSEDCTAYIKNPSFEDGFTNWVQTNLQTQKNSQFPKKSGGYYVDKWTGSGGVGSASVSQTISNLPNGIYKLIVGAMNYTQSDTDKKNTGAYIFAGDEKETVYTPNDYSLTFISIAGEVEIGFVAKNASGNWIAVDNFRLYRIGNVNFEIVSEELNRIIADAEALKSDVKLNTDIDELQSAIDVAKLINAASTDDEIQKAYQNLRKAFEKYSKQHISAITDVSKSSPAIYERKVLYDCNGDGKLEYLSQSTVSSNWCWNDKDGVVIKEIPNTSNHALKEEKILLVEDLNNDEIPDLLLQYRILALSKGDGYTFLDNFTEGSSADGHALYNVFAMDINHDGRKDIVGFLSGQDAQGYTTTFTPIAFLQQKSGDFICTPVILSESPYSASDKSSFTQRQSVPSNASFAYGMFVGSTSTSLATSNISMASKDIQFVDFNNDGFLDMLDPEKGFSMFSMSDGSYYPTVFSGLVSPVDFNNDGLQDFAIFNKSKHQIFVNIAQSDGTYQEIKLLDNGNITAMYCQDLDGDNMPDIMALAPTKNMSFIVFFKNQGNATFEKYERVLPVQGYYDFLQPCDLLNTGVPVIPFVAGANQLAYISWDDDFNVREEPCLVNGEQLYLGSREGAAFRDYDGDGRLDIPSKLYQAGACLASMAKSANTAPSKVNAPSCFLDKLTGQLRINWEFTTDSENSRCDLTYEVRIGTNSAVSDVALHEVGKSNWCIINMGQLPAGTYHVSVRAKDSYGKRGDWSDCTMVNHANPLADFIISKKKTEDDNRYEYEKIGYKKDFFTSDVIVVTSLSDTDVTFSASPDGTVVSTGNGKAQISFSSMGTKTISMHTVNGNIIHKQIVIQPFKVKEMRDYYVDAQNYADLDADGVSEYLDGNIKTWTGKEYVSIPTLFNSDLSCGGVFADKTRNGYPDIKGATINDVYYNWLLNKGNLNFEVDNEELMDTEGHKLGTDNDYRIKSAIDINNDGLVDICTYRDLFLNRGNGMYEKIESDSRMVFTDYDQDGLMDIVLVGLRSSVYRNVGDGNFDLVKKDLKTTSQDNKSGGHNFWTNEFFFCDVNGDGADDIVNCYNHRMSTGVYVYTDEIVGDIVAYLASADHPYEKTMTLPGIPLRFDLNNDGKMDYYRLNITNQYETDTIFISQGEKYVPIIADVKFWPSRLQDVDNDNFPELLSNSKVYSIVSHKTNTPPTIPSNVTVSQTDKEIIVNWDAATDAETPAAQLLYNLSVKEKGREGDGAYVISPMNATRDEAKVMDYGIHHLRHATRYPIPLGCFEVGKTYEFCVQAVDAWMMHSPFSQKVEFSVVEKNLVSMPEISGVSIPTTYKLNNINGETPIITASDGAVIKDGMLTWNTPGTKIVTAKVGTLTSQQQILIHDMPDLNLPMPQKVMAGANVSIKLPEVFRTASDKVKLEADKQVAITMQGDSVANICMPIAAGTYHISVVYKDKLFGSVNNVQNVTTVELRPTIISVSDNHGKNKLIWDTSGVDESLVKAVRIYRETNLLGSYEMIAEMPLNLGEYTDEGSRSGVQSYRYRMTYIARDGDIESLPSDTHRTVLLMANYTNDNNLNLHWTPYEGADVENYTILMGTSAENLTPIATLPGDRKNYLVKSGSDGTAFYALQYTFANHHSPFVTKAATKQTDSMTEITLSNTLCSDEACEIVMAESLQIQCMEGEAVLNKDQKQIHLQAIVFPFSAFFTDVAWCITDGESLATIDAYGVLCLKANRGGGIVKVEASTIDGSNIKELIEVDVAASFISGDANDDGAVNVFDVTTTVNYILGGGDSNFNEDAADVNGDGIVNVFDVTKMVNIILGVNAGAQIRGLVEDGENGTMQPLAVGPDLLLVVEDASRYVAMQFDVMVHEGETVEDVVLNSAPKHVLSCRQIEKNHYRVVAYSMQNASFDPKENVLISLKRARGASVENAVFVTTDGRCIDMVIANEATRIDTITQKTNFDNIYNLSGQYMGTDMEKLPKGVYISNGKKFIIQ